VASKKIARSKLIEVKKPRTIKLRAPSLIQDLGDDVMMIYGPNARLKMAEKKLDGELQAKVEAKQRESADLRDIFRRIHDDVCNASQLAWLVAKNSGSDGVEECAQALSAGVEGILNNALLELTEFDKRSGIRVLYHDDNSPEIQDRNAAEQGG